jgi:hypothetical protein
MASGCGTAHRVIDFDADTDSTIDASDADVGSDAADEDTRCTPSCEGRYCGSDGCGGSCGTCPTMSCHDSSCDDATGTCRWARSPDGTPCDDDYDCTTVDRCHEGACFGEESITPSVTNVFTTDPFLASDIYDIELRDDIAFVASSAGLEIFDLSDRSGPTPVGWIGVALGPKPDRYRMRVASEDDGQRIR